MPVRDVESHICEWLDFQLWLLKAEAKCDAYNLAEEECQEEWNAKRKELPEPLVQKALRKAADESVESALESFCDVQMRLINNFMC